MTETLTKAPILTEQIIRTGTDKTLSSSAPCEIELKLIAPATAIDLLRKTPYLLQHSRNKGTTRHLETIYFDTEDYLLRRKGLALRVRRSGKKYIQTLKTEQSRTLLTRHEWETAVPGPQPDFELLTAESGISIPDTLSGQALLPLFTTRIRRHSQYLDLFNALVQISFDEGFVENACESETLSEIELELKRGEPVVLYEIALSLLDIVPLRLSMLSKAERGYNLNQKTPPAAVKSFSADLEKDDTIDDGIVKLLDSCYRHMIANLAAAENGCNPDGIHQLRVALRRFRTACSILRREVPSPVFDTLGNDAKALAHCLGVERNWDVFIGQTLPQIEAGGILNVDIARLQHEAENLKGQSHIALREMLADAATNRFLLSLGMTIENKSWRMDMPQENLHMLDDSMKNLSKRSLTHIYKLVRKRGKHFKTLDTAQRHKLRLTLKKLRYASEFFVPLYKSADEASAYLKRLSKLQDILGLDNDISTANNLLHDIEQHVDTPASHRAIGAVMGWQAYHRDDMSKHLQRMWRQFLKTDPFWS